MLKRVFSQFPLLFAFISVNHTFIPKYLISFGNYNIINILWQVLVGPIGNFSKNGLIHFLKGASQTRRKKSTDFCRRSLRIMFGMFAHKIHKHSKKPVAPNRSHLGKFCLKKKTSHSILVYFTFRIDIRDEPARPGPARPPGRSLTAYFSATIKDTDFKF